MFLHLEGYFQFHWGNDALNIFFYLTKALTELYHQGKCSIKTNFWLLMPSLKYINNLALIGSNLPLLEPLFPKVQYGAADTTLMDRCNQNLWHLGRSWRMHFTMYISTIRKFLLCGECPVPHSSKLCTNCSKNSQNTW